MGGGANRFPPAFIQTAASSNVFAEILGTKKLLVAPYKALSRFVAISCVNVTPTVESNWAITSAVEEAFGSTILICPKLLLFA